MWPFKKRVLAAHPSGVPEHASFGQLDITERFGDDLKLGPDDWITTLPLNSQTESPGSKGLPRVGASEDETYGVAEHLSRMRESAALPNDGVYCPVCHIANIQLSRLRSPCPKCGRPLLKFGWD